MGPGARRRPHGAEGRLAISRVPTLAREALLRDRSLTGTAWCRRLSDLTDAWLAELFVDAVGDAPFTPIALVAVGGYGRRELAPHSDLDLLLLHDTRRGVADVAERLWYPIWDAKLKLGHAVRTVKEALTLADDDLDTATALLTARHLAGDAELTDRLASRAKSSWQRRSRRWLTDLDGSVERRHAEHGEVAFLLEPDLKDGRGGLRDAHALGWADAAQLVLLPGDGEALQRAYDVVLGARVELQRRLPRPSDVLRLDEQDAVAAALGDRDADALMARIAGAGRTIAWTSDETWRRIRSGIEGPAGREFRRDRPLAPGVLRRDGEVHLAHDVDPASDPTAVLRVALAAARTGLGIERTSLDRLAARTPTFPDPWPAGAIDDVCALLLSGPSAITVLETLDQRGLMVKVLPEWKPVRNRPQRNALHRFTVDRHLWEAAAQAAALADRVERPDLLVLGALLHDLGKGSPGDHSEAGVAIARRLGPRLGLPPADVAVLETLVRHHLLLPDVATRRDLADHDTIDPVAEAVGDPAVLDLLAALTEADGLATGPAAWSEWKAGLVAELVERVHDVLGATPASEQRWAPFPSAAVAARMGERRRWIEVDGEQVTVVNPNQPGIVARVAGVLSLHGLGVLAARVHADGDMAAIELRVASPSGGAEVRWEQVGNDLAAALDGRLALAARLAERARTYERRTPVATLAAVPSVTFDDSASSDATVVEVRAPDRIGLLYRITSTMADLLLDIRHAKVQTLGPEVVDAFYVRTATGAKLSDPAHRREVERALLYVIGE